jgi:small GTP-binding protein
MENACFNSKYFHLPEGENFFINLLYGYREKLSLVYFEKNELEKERRDYLAELDKLFSHIDEPAQVVIAGGFNAGKSTFINSLLNREIMPTLPIRATATVNSVMAGEQQEFIVFRKDGSQTVKSYSDDNYLNSEIRKLMDSEHDIIERIEIKCLNESFLDKFIVIDTPGLDFSDEDTANTLRYVEQADAIVWVLHPEGIRSQDLEPIAQFNQRNPASPLVVIINQIDTLDAEERDTVFNQVKEKLKNITSNIFLLSAQNALEARQEKDSQKLKKSGFEELNHYLSNHLFNAYRDLKDQRIKQQIKRKSETLREHIDSFLSETSSDVFFRIPVNQEEMKKLLLEIAQKENDLQKHIIELENELSELRIEKDELVKTGIIKNGFTLPSIEHLLEFLPAIFNNFWGIVSPLDFSLIVKIPIQLSSPYIYPTNDEVSKTNAKFCTLPISEQLKIKVFCKDLKNKYNKLEQRSGMQIL